MLMRTMRHWDPIRRNVNGNGSANMNANGNASEIGCENESETMLKRLPQLKLERTR